MQSSSNYSYSGTSMEDTMGNHNALDGTLSPDDFYVAAKALCDKWEHATADLPQWTWIPCARTPMGASRNEGYLSLEHVYNVGLNEDPVGEGSFSKDEEIIDSATLVHTPSYGKHIYSFHIVYSFSYKVPMLYFRGYRCDGQPLDLDDIQKDLPDSSLRHLNESKWTFMTLEEHPYLHRPWYTLHPCGTSDWMKLLLGGIQKEDPKTVYLPSWLSVVGQAVGLKIPLDLHRGGVPSDGSM